MNAVDLLRRSALFQAFGYGELASLARELEPLQVAPGAVLLTQGEAVRAGGAGLFLLAEGQLRLRVERADGTVGVDQRLDPVQAIGLLALVRAEPRRAGTLTAVTACQLLHLPRDRWQRLVGGHDDLAFGLQLLAARQLAADLRRTEAALRAGLEPAAG
ncbi:MAG: cyclic nucleotide-binding domain-containing protein [Alphaproteobacteria bacterium]|nr:cyclic nucleotide-binding domain-containing protein [Alphaproteobacteria bacterium]